MVRANRHVVALSVEPVQQLQSVGDGQESVRTVLFSRRRFGRDTERMEAPEAVPVGEERFVVDGEQRTAERREYGELVIGPLDRGQRRPQNAHFFAIVERTAADQQMPDAARFVRVDVGTRHVGAPTVEPPEQHGDVARLDRDTLRRGSLRRRPGPAFRHRPPAFPHHPVDERADRIGKGCLDGPPGHAAPVSVRTRDRQRHHGRLRRRVLAVGCQRHVPGT